MAQILGGLFGGSYVSVIVVVVVLALAVTLRLYFMRNPGKMNAKCKKCGNVFDASHYFAAFHIGTLKMLNCPACGKTSLMKTHVKDPVTWPSENREHSTEQTVSTEELESKRIEDSKYERNQ